MTIPAVGSLFHDDFRVERKLSEGGMGAVFVVQQLSTGVPRALKIMKPELVDDPELRRRFELEAKVASKIPSEHVVQVIAAGIDEGTGAPFLVMELLAGETLSDVVGSSGPFTHAALLRTLRELCHALGGAHDANIVHRDLKPDNVFLARSLRAGGEPIVKVLDFGIAKIVDEARTAETTAAIGTPTWMAPEQTDRKGMISPATDVWALGLIAYFLLTGRSYWIGASSGSVAALFREILFDPIVPASERAREQQAGELPPSFDAWFAGCVARDPAKRFRDARVALEAFTASSGAVTAAGGGPASGSPITVEHPSAPVPRWAAPHHPTVPGAPLPGVIKTPRKSLYVTIASLVVGAACLVGVRLAIKAYTATDYGCLRLDVQECLHRCDKGSANACFDMAEKYERGEDTVAKNLDEARSHYQRACGKDHVGACGAYADLLVAKKDDEIAKLYAQDACKENDVRGCFALATLKLRVESMRDEEGAARLFATACEDKRYDRACVARGDLALARKESAAVRKSFYEPACGRRFGPACVRLVEHALRGEDGPPDLPGARRHALDGCAGMDPRSCGLDGALRITKRPYDSSEAVERLTRGCDDDEKDPVACERLGFLRDRGWGTAVDTRAADALYAVLNSREACADVSDRELVAACARASTRTGMKAVARDVGRQYLKKSCENGDPWGCLYAGDESVGDETARAAFYEAACKKSQLPSLDVTAPISCAEVDHRKGEDELRKGNTSVADDLFERACKAGAGSGCLARAKRMLEAKGAKPFEVQQLYFSACEALNPALEACVVGADYAFQTGYPDAAFLYEKMRSACRRGHEPTCKALDDRKIAR